jgi:hypothetical protein
MANGTSKSVNTPAPTTASTVVVGVLGMLILGGAGLAIIAATALLPAYASLRNAQHQRDCLAVETEYIRACNEACENRVRAAETDPLYRERIAIEQGGYVPTTGTPLASTVESHPDHVYVTRPPMPPAPSGRVFEIAQRLTKPGLRRGLYLMGACLILVGMLLGSPAPAEDDGLA